MAVGLLPVALVSIAEYSVDLVDTSASGVLSKVV